MAIASAIVGARKIGQTITWQTLDGSPLNISGAIISAVIEDLDTGIFRAADGTLEVYTDGSDGVFSWAYGAVDVGTPGRFLVQFAATYPDLQKAISQPVEWFVYRAFTVS